LDKIKGRKKGGIYMYDAKLENKTDEKDLKFQCIEDRSYFMRIQSEELFKCKSSYVPIENLIQ
jgi:hypothetical protein